MSKRLNKSYNRAFLELLGARPVAFNPVMARLGGSANAGLLMSQLLYWWGKGAKFGWIYKTIKEMEEETCLTRSEQTTAIRIWVNLGVLILKRTGIPPRRHFHINVEKLQELLQKYVPIGEKDANQSVGIGNSKDDNVQHNTETTPESTDRDSSLQELISSKNDEMDGDWDY